MVRLVANPVVIVAQCRHSLVKFDNWSDKTTGIRHHMFSWTYEASYVWNWQEISTLLSDIQDRISTTFPMCFPDLLCCHLPVSTLTFSLMFSFSGRPWDGSIKTWNSSSNWKTKQLSGLLKTADSGLYSTCVSASDTFWVMPTSLPPLPPWIRRDVAYVMRCPSLQVASYVRESCFLLWEGCHLPSLMVILSIVAFTLFCLLSSKMDSCLVLLWGEGLVQYQNVLELLCLGAL